MNICENCGKEHDGSYGSGRFCCDKCSRSFSGKHFYRDRFKHVKCCRCGNDFPVYSNVSNKTMCDDCIDYTKHRSTCKICGSEYDSRCGCQNTFCKKHTMQQIKTLIKYFGFDDTKLGSSDAEKEFYRVRDMLYDLYWNKGMSSTDLARMFNYCSEPTNITQKFFKGYLDIPVKSLSYSTVENFENGKLGNQEIETQYVCGWHTAWNGKEVYLRSSYELDYAKELDDMRVEYDVECLRIKYFDSIRGLYRCAVPDFYIPSQNLIVEIKSDWTLNKQEMIDKRKAYLEQGYKFKLILEHKEVEL